MAAMARKALGLSRVTSTVPSRRCAILAIRNKKRRTYWRAILPECLASLFRRTLQKPEMEQLLQRVIAACHIGPMDSAETRAYIMHRLRTVGWNGDPTIDDEAFEEIYRNTGGIPRRINLLCNRLLLSTFLSSQTHVDAAAVEAIAQEVRSELGETSEEV